jgi:hypothetical protein
MLSPWSPHKRFRKVRVAKQPLFRSNQGRDLLFPEWSCPTSPPMKMCSLSSAIWRWVVILWLTPDRTRRNFGHESWTSITKIVEIIRSELLGQHKAIGMWSNYKLEGSVDTLLKFEEATIVAWPTQIRHASLSCIFNWNPIILFVIHVIHI